MHIYDHTTTYVPVQYKIEKIGFWIFKRNSPSPGLPMPESLLSADEYQREMNSMGSQGWELVSVQPLLRGAHHGAQGKAAAGTTSSYSLTAGFYFFWKRYVPKEAR